MIEGANIPESGTMYAAFTNRIIYERYKKAGDRKYLLENGECIDLDIIEDREKLLELHMFDSAEEYRCIKVRKHGYKEFSVNDEIEHDDVYTENIFVDRGGEQKKYRQKIGVINYICYNEDDLPMIVNYRLQEVE